MLAAQKSIPSSPWLADFVEFQHIENDLRQPWCILANDTDGYAKNAILTQCEALAKQALSYLQQENGTDTNERIRVAVIGDFSSGKSSFINSLLGYDLCPVDVAPSTSCITTFKYGDVERIYHVNSSLSKLIDRQTYSNLSTHQVGAQQYEFEVYYPFDGFRDVELYDTPGFNNPKNKDDARITLEKCTAADAILLVFDIRRGDFGDDLLERIDELQRAKPNLPVYIIANQADRKSPNAVKNICAKLAAQEFQAGIVAYDSKEELRLQQWQTIPKDSIGITDLDQVGHTCLVRLSPGGATLQIKRVENVSEKRKVILAWFEAIQRQKSTMLAEHANRERLHYLNNAIDFCKGVSKTLSSCQESELPPSAQELHWPTEKDWNEVLQAIKIAIESSWNIGEIPKSGIFSNDWEIKFVESRFKAHIDGAAVFKRFRKFTEDFMKSIPADQFEEVKEMFDEPLKIRKPHLLFQWLQGRLHSIGEHNKRHDSEDDAREFIFELREDADGLVVPAYNEFIEAWIGSIYRIHVIASSHLRGSNASQGQQISNLRSRVQKLRRRLKSRVKIR